MTETVERRGIVLSSSSISSYLRCRRQYALGYVFRRPGIQNVAAAIGVAVHAGVEALHLAQPAQDALHGAFAAEAVRVPASELAADPDALPDARRMLRTYEEEVFPTFHPDLVEAPFAVLVEGVVLTGILDGADTRTDEVRDLKTTAGKTVAGKKPSSFNPASYDLQLGLYSLGYIGLTGRRPRRTALDVVTRRGTYRQYEREPNVGEAIDILGIVRDGIDRGDFAPTGAFNGSCTWCPFVAECGYAVVD